MRDKQLLSGRVLPDPSLLVVPVMKTAEALLSELIEQVRPPKGCAIKLIECLGNGFLNWIIIGGDMTDAQRERFNNKVLHLCQTDPRVDWSTVSESEDSRRTIIYSDTGTTDGKY